MMSKKNLSFGAAAVGRTARLLTAGFFVFGLGCAPEVEDIDRPRDVLLVTIDTARADRFSYTGLSPVMTPATDRVAEEGAAFLTAVAPSPITLVSHASLFTGRDPFVHGVRNNGDFALGPQAVTLAEVLSDRGWTTSAFVATAVLDRKYGLDQGFLEYDDEIVGSGSQGMLAYARRPGNEVVDAALRWLREGPASPTFMWVHLYDPHAPYEPPEPERSRYPDSPYDGALAFADRMVGELLEGYRSLGRYEDSLVIITSDHGESLNEHQERTHGVFIYDATVRIPLVMRGPGITPATRVASPVALIDLMPTILGLVGIESPATVQGRDFGPLLLGSHPVAEDRAIYVESQLPWLSFGWSPLYGLRTQRWKYIEGAASELYDLESDPDELENVASQHEEVVTRMSSGLARAVESGGAPTALSLQVDEAERAKLEALGYVSHSAGDEAPDEESELPDPRDRIVTMNKMHAALIRFGEGDEQGAIADLERMLEDEPQNHSAIATLGSLRYRAGDFDGAAGSYARAAGLAPHHAHYSELESLALERSGRYEEALQACQRALAAESDRTRSKEARWRLLARLERYETLIAELEREMFRDPENGTVHALLLETRHGFEPSPELVEELEKALTTRPGDHALTAALARAVSGMGEAERGEALYREVLKKRPGDLDATLVVGGRALADRKYEEARDIVETGVLQNPEDAAMQVLAARLRMAEGEFNGAREALVRAYKLRPGWAHTWLAAGELGLLEGLPEQAAANVDRAAAAADDDPDLWRRIAEAYRRLHREEDAEAADRRAAAAG